MRQKVVAEEGGRRYKAGNLILFCKNESGWSKFDKIRFSEAAARTFQVVSVNQRRGQSFEIKTGEKNKIRFVKRLLNYYAE